MKQLSNQATAAKLIRQELKAAFPLTKFRVTSRSFSMGDAVDIRWDNGPSTEAVKDITDKYQYGKFDGMRDIYEYSNNRKDIQQSKYVTTHRTITDDNYNVFLSYAKKHFSGCDHINSLDASDKELLNKWGAWTVRNLAYRFIGKVDLTNGLTFSAIEQAIGA